MLFLLRLLYYFCESPTIFCVILAFLQFVANSRLYIEKLAVRTELFYVEYLILYYFLWFFLARFFLWGPCLLFLFCLLFHQRQNHRLALLHHFLAINVLAMLNDFGTESKSISCWSHLLERPHESLLLPYQTYLHTFIPCWPFLHWVFLSEIKYYNY